VTFIGAAHALQIESFAYFGYTDTPKSERGGDA